MISYHLFNYFLIELVHFGCYQSLTSTNKAEGTPPAYTEVSRKSLEMWDKPTDGLSLENVETRYLPWSLPPVTLPSAT